VEKTGFWAKNEVLDRQKQWRDGAGESDGGGPMPGGSGGDPNAFERTMASELYSYREGETVSDCRWYALSVSDTGIGMSEEGVKKLFTPFTQLDDETDVKKYQGTGLGLSICRDLTTLMGGFVFVMSTPEKGSCFAIIIALRTVIDRHASRLSSPSVGTLSPSLVEMASNPQGHPDDEDFAPTRQDHGGSLSSTIDVQARPAEPSPAKEDGRSTSARKNLVLVAEDNLINQKVILSMIRRLKRYEVQLATNGLEARDLALRHHARAMCVLMDLHMPEMDGIEACQAIRSWEKQHEEIKIPIIALTADVLDSTRERCIDAGMDLFMTKPVKLDRLSDVLNKFSKESADDAHHTS